MMSKDRTKSVYINKSHKDEFSKVKSDRPEAVHVRVIYIKSIKCLGRPSPDLLSMVKPGSNLCSVAPKVFDGFFHLLPR